MSTQDDSSRLTAEDAEQIRSGYLPPGAVAKVSEPVREYHGVTCSHPHNLPYNDECAVWWLRKPETAELWRLAHTGLGRRA